MDFTKTDLNKTVHVKKDWIEANRKWYVVDASWKTLWRLAVEIAKKLIWKDKVYQNDFWDTWDYVVVQNAKDLVVTWNKVNEKIYYKHTGYKWHLRKTPYSRMLEKHPERIIYFAVRWMLPKNKLRKQRLLRLKIFVQTTDKYNNLPLEQLKING